MITKDAVESFEFSLPPKDLLNQLTDTINPINNKIKLYYHVLMQLFKKEKIFGLVTQPPICRLYSTNFDNFSAFYL